GFRKVTGVDGTVSSEATVAFDQIQYFHHEGNFSYTTNNPIASGFRLNPYPIVRDGVTLPAYSTAVVVDQTYVYSGSTGSSGTRYNDLSKRVYLYNLGTAVGDGSADPTFGVFTSLASKEDMALAIGYSTTDALR